MNALKKLFKGGYAAFKIKNNNIVISDKRPINLSNSQYASKVTTRNRETVLRSFYGKKHESIKAGKLILLAVPVTTFVLGTWQIKRKIWKDGIIKQLENLTTLEPVDFPEDLEELKKMEYHPVKIKGKFDHRREIYMGPRSLYNNKKSSQGSVISSPSAGYLVITPFTLSDRDLTIMVNRGWVPSKQRLPETRKNSQITEEVEMVGIVRHSENRQPLGMRNIPQKGHWMYRDLNKMAQYLDTEPILIDADAASTVPEGPIGGQTVVNVPNNHLTYIITWYGLSVITLYLWYMRYIKV